MSGMDSDILEDDNASLCAAIQSDVAAFLEGLPRLNADAHAFLPTPHLQVSAHGSKCMRGIWVPDGSDGLPVPSGHRPEKSDVEMGFACKIDQWFRKQTKWRFHRTAKEESIVMFATWF